MYEDQDSALSAKNQGVEPLEDPFQGISSTDKLKAALQYTSAGLKIFPCRPSGKSPGTSHGFKDASGIIRQVAELRLQALGWFDFILPDGNELTVTPHDNWGFEPGPAGFTVIDIDPKNGGDKTWKELVNKHGRIVTRMVRTPSGGVHLYFRGTIKAINKKLGPGIDTRCFGGYVLLPPSSVRGRPYAWVNETVPIAPLPDWARDLAEAQDEAKCPGKTPRGNGDEHASEADAAFEAWAEAGGEGGRFEFLLSRIGDEASGGDGFYNPMLSAAGYGVRIGLGLDEIIEQIEEAALSTPRGNRALSYVKEKLAELRHAVRKFRRLDQTKDREAATEAGEEGGPTEGTDPFADAKAAETAGEETIWITKEEAAPRVDQVIDGWIYRAGLHRNELSPVVIALATPAGFGKTRRVMSKWHGQDGRASWDVEKLLDEDLSAISEAPTGPLGKIAVAVPTHNLGIEFEQHVIPEVEEEVGVSIEMPRLLGRRPETCGRHAVVNAAVANGHPPKQCCKQTLPDGTERFCRLFEACSATPGQYQHELDRVRKARNSIIMHKHLALSGMPELQLDWRKSQWIDEDPTSTFLFGQDGKEFATVKDIKELVTDRDFTELERRKEERPQRDGETDVGTSRKGLKRLEALRDVLMRLHETQATAKLEDFAAWAPEELYCAANDREAIERWRRGKIDPTLSDAELTEQLAKKSAPKKLAGLFRRLAKEKEARGTGPIYSFEWREDKLVMRGRLPTIELPNNILLTDATASPIILQAVFPHHKIDFQQLNIHRNAYVTQVQDKTFSRYWLLTKKNLARVVAWLTELAARYPKLAIFTTKRIRCEMTSEDRKQRLPPFALLPGTTARIGHYGNLKGSDQFKDCDAVVILGREQPNVADLEDEMKALFYDTKEPLKFVKTIRIARGNVTERDYTTVHRPYLMRDGPAQKSEVQVHPDPRGQALLERSRESEIIQAIDRGRLIHHEGPPKPVFILCSIPLPGVEVDRLVTWKELVGPEWLRHCVDATAAAQKNVLPLSAKWLAEHFNEEFPGPKAAERALANDRVIEMLEAQGANPQLPNITLYERVGGLPFGLPPWFPGWHLVRFQIAKEGRRPSHALVRDSADPAPAIAEVMGRDPAEIILCAAPEAAAGEAPSPHVVHSTSAET